VYQVFKAFATFGRSDMRDTSRFSADAKPTAGDDSGAMVEIDNSRFMKMLRDAGLIDANLTAEKVGRV
jgi:hypothetical protein